MNNKATRRLVREKNKGQKLVSGFTWGGIGLAVLVVIGLMVWQGIKPAAGESVPIMVSEAAHPC